MYTSRKTLQLQFQGFLATPPLWKDYGPINKQQYFISPIPSSPEFEKDLLVPENLILGKRVEYFFAFYVKNFSHESLLAQNVVINYGKTTIGEIDFLLLNEEKKEYIHVELVYKFYLFDPDLNKGLSQWIGPNRNDTLMKKLCRLKNHQFPLLYREESHELIKTLQLPLEKILQKVCFKANLFVPLSMVNTKFPKINNDCIQGFWIKMRDFLEKDYGGYHFHIPTKQNWTMEPLYCEYWHDFAKTELQLLPLLQANRSPLVWMKTAEKEFQRFFIVWW